MNVLGSTMLKYSKHGCRWHPAPPKLLHIPFGLIIVSKTASIQVGFEFRKRKEVRWKAGGSVALPN